MTQYFRYESLNYHDYLISTFLDPQVYPILTENEKDDAVEMIKSNFVSEAGDTYQQIINKQQKRPMAEDDRLLARSLGKQVDDADDEIGERPTIYLVSKGYTLTEEEKWYTFTEV